MRRILNLMVLILLGFSSFAQKPKKPTKAKAPVKSQVEAPAVATAPITANAPVQKKKKLPPKDGFYTRAEIDSNTNALVEYAPVREEDVFFAKRIWREIDLRDTVNSVLKSPKSNLMFILMEAIKAGELDAYAAFDSTLKSDDKFSVLLTPDSAVGVGLGKDTISKEGKIIINPKEFIIENVSGVLKYRLKEDWILDVKRSVFEPRIVGLAPLRFNEQSKDWVPLFWIYYPDARNLLSQKRVTNPSNDASSLTLDDIFIRRLFTSYIVKQTNPGDDRIKDIISDPKDRLYESEKIKKDILDYEQGLWEY